MKKYFVLISVLTLAACGGGSGGGFQPSEKITAIEIPQQRISTKVEENKNITGMVSSVNNAGEMTIAVENAIGADLLTELSKDLDAMAESIRNYSNREISNRRNSSTSDVQTISSSTRSQAAYAFLEYARRFRGLDNNNQLKFINEHPEHHNFILGWGKLFCDCDVSGLSDNQLLGLFEDSANQQRFDAFYKKNHYKEILLDDVRFNVVGFNNGQVDDSEMKFVVDSKNGVITSFEILEDGKSIAIMDRNTDSNGNYIDTFKDVGWKYKITVEGFSSAYFTDTFSSRDISQKELRKKIESSLTNNEGCDASCKSAILTAFDNGNGRWVEQISATSFDLKGQSVGLSYSDFGYITMVAEKFDGQVIPEDKRDPDHSVVIGGFKAKQIDPSLFASETMDFRGTAIGAAAYYLENDEESKRITTDDNAATLHVVNGVETLTMPFNGYYTVTVTKNGNDATVNFSDYPDAANDKFKFDKESGISANSGDLVNVETKYYGDNFVPTEVVGGVAYEEHPDNGLKSFESAFGMKKQ